MSLSSFSWFKGMSKLFDFELTAHSKGNPIIIPPINNIHKRSPILRHGPPASLLHQPPYRRNLIQYPKLGLVLIRLQTAKHPMSLQHNLCCVRCQSPRIPQGVAFVQPGDYYLFVGLVVLGGAEVAGGEDVGFGADEQVLVGQDPFVVDEG